MNRFLGILMIAAVLACGSMAHAGAMPSCQTRTTTVKANDFDAYSVTFVAGQSGQVRVHSYGDTFVNVGIMDKDGNVLVSDNDRSGDALLAFVPSRTDTYWVVVLNRAPVSNSYYISTN